MLTRLEAFYHGLRHVVMVLVVLVLGGLVVADTFVLWEAHAAIQTALGAAEGAQLVAAQALGKRLAPSSVPQAPK